MCLMIVAVRGVIRVKNTPVLLLLYFALSAAPVAAEPICFAEESVSAGGENDRSRPRSHKFLAAREADIFYNRRKRSQIGKPYDKGR